MPKGENFNFCVIVGNETLVEHYHKSSTYIEADFSSTASYPLAFGDEKLLVTPYEINFEHYGDSALWYELWIDGEKVFNKPLPAKQRTMTVNGKKQNDSIQELVFSFPAEETTKKDFKSDYKSALKSIGKITLLARKAVYQGTEHREFRNTRVEHNQPLDTKTYRSVEGVSKKDCFQITNGSYSLATTYAGRQLASFVDTGIPVRRTFDKYSKGKVLEELTVFYRPRQTLKEMGVMICDEHTFNDKTAVDLTQDIKDFNEEERKIKVESTPQIPSNSKSTSTPLITNIKKTSTPLLSCIRNNVQTPLNTDRFFDELTPFVVGGAGRKKTSSEVTGCDSSPIKSQLDETTEDKTPHVNSREITMAGETPRFMPRLNMNRKRKLQTSTIHESIIVEEDETECEEVTIHAEDLGRSDIELIILDEDETKDTINQSNSNENDHKDIYIIEEESFLFSPQLTMSSSCTPELEYTIDDQSGAKKQRHGNENEARSTDGDNNKEDKKNKSMDESTIYDTDDSCLILEQSTKDVTVLEIEDTTVEGTSLQDTTLHNISNNSHLDHI